MAATGRCRSRGIAARAPKRSPRSRSRGATSARSYRTVCDVPAVSTASESVRPTPKKSAGIAVLRGRRAASRSLVAHRRILRATLSISRVACRMRVRTRRPRFVPGRSGRAAASIRRAKRATAGRSSRSSARGTLAWCSRTAPRTRRARGAGRRPRGRPGWPPTGGRAAPAAVVRASRVRPAARQVRSSGRDPCSGAWRPRRRRRPCRAARAPCAGWRSDRAAVVRVARERRGCGGRRPRSQPQRLQEPSR